MKSSLLINLGTGMMLLLSVWLALAPGEALALPPRPEDVVSGEKDGDDDDTLLGAYIELQVHPPAAELWAIVQWQDSGGDWHDVNGWRSQVSPDRIINWWVAPKDQGAGPFRWVVYRVEDRGSLVGTSQPFYLPKRGKTLLVTAPVAGPFGSGRAQLQPTLGETAVPPQYAQPEILIPETGGSFEAQSGLITTAFSLLATLVLLIVGVVSAFRSGPSTGLL